MRKPSLLQCQVLYGDRIARLREDLGLKQDGLHHLEGRLERFHWRSQQTLHIAIEELAEFARTEVIEVEG